MTRSLNEVEATAKKAARGAGYSWGMAEEAGKATSWLCARGLDGCKAMSALLAQTDGIALAELAPAQISGEWRAKSKLMCPILAGSVVSDCAYRLKTEEIILGPVAEPLLVLAFVAGAARQVSTTLTAIWYGVTAVTDGDAISVSASGNTLHAPMADRVVIRAGGDLGSTQPRQSRATPDAAAWTRLEHLAHRTYAPATEESRLKGAGSGLIDID